MEINNNNKLESSSYQQRILITGISGLIRNILFNYLIKKYSTKYEIFGLDQHLNMSIDKFFQCDVTDRIKLHKIIEEQKINIIIHLAALLENYPDIEMISHVNIDGTKNIFEAPGVHRIIYASTIRTVFGYLNYEPYLSIRKETFNDITMLKNLQKLTISNNPPLPDTQTSGHEVYSQSKIIGEQMAIDIVKNSSKSIICVRFGWVNIDNQPGNTWSRTVWLSHRDLCLFIDKVLQAPDNISGIYFLTSNNHRRWVDLDDAKRDFDFVPQDGAEKL
ncbi:unnamed protein product [Rotaria sordida]|uniref:NAD-dependent epimerase/dehydratase domain-containing protein n=1 Tax=Rotaria sordida TaxID=392033 RepID=A0A814JF28_9BILA|nr:unnamed protein product [Rotaria sordida]CAF3561247.1 unnamed protein product [Rotaria sordida]